jgi:hypothetical protein
MKGGKTIGWAAHHVRYHMHFSNADGEIKGNAITHIVNTRSLRTLCGRNAENWPTIKQRLATCDRCRQLQVQ